jgi:hypothetical protein
VLENQLAVALRDQAIAHAAELPAQLRQPFIDGFSKAVQAGFAVGPGQSGGVQLPPGLPPQVVAQIGQVGRGLGEGGRCNEDCGQSHAHTV